jgi:UDP-glucose 4-epimerase
VKALVTGGAGFIGHHLVNALLARGDEVAVLDDYSTGDPARLDPVRSRITVVDGSILDPDALDRAIEGCEVVFHEGALPSVARSLAAPLASNEVNVAGTIQVMLAAARNGVRRVVYAGSSSVYGIPRTLPCHEDLRPDPESPYGVSKLAGELYLHRLGHQHGIGTVALRYFNVFGEGQDPKSEYAAVIPRFITAVLTGQRPTINGDGSVSRDFTHVQNVISANLLAARSDAPTGITCNIACNERRTLLDLLNAISAAAGRSVEPIFGPPRPGDILHSMADITRAREALHYEVVVPFDEGIGRAVAWYQASLEASPG